MAKDTDKTKKQVKLSNPGIPIEQEIYVYCKNKKPIHKGTKNFNYKPNNKYNSIAIKTDKANYLCLDFDGYSNSNDTQTYNKEKQATAEKIKDNFIQLLEKQTTNYRIDKTASNKYHVWLKHPDVPSKEFLKLPKFLSNDGKVTINGLVEIFSTFTKHNVHLAGSTITKENNTIGTYENVYAGASFDELASIPNVKALLISAITSAGYLQKIEQADKISNTSKYYFQDSMHNGYIKEFRGKENKIYYSYVSDEVIISKNFYTVSKDKFSIEHITENCTDEFKSIISSIYYYHQELDDNQDTDTAAMIENQEISKQLIQVYKKYWQNTKGSRHYLMLATSHVLIKYLNFNDVDLDFFFDELADSVDEIDYAHRNTIKEGLNSHAEKEYGIPTIIDILGCDKGELTFLSKSNAAVENELEYVERIKPTLTDEIMENERKFKKIYQQQLKDYFDGNNTYISIERTESTTDLIAQILSDTMYKEKDNIAKLLLALIGVVIGTNRSYVIISGVSNAGKTALVKTVKQVIPGIYRTQLDELSDAAFTRHTEDKGKYAYNRMIIDYGDKGNIKGYEKAIQEMARFQNLITDGTYTYRVTNNENNSPKGTKDLEIVTDGFAQIITTTNETLARIDEQLITRSEILYVGKNSKKDISRFNSEHEISNKKKQVKAIVQLIQSHILYSLNKYNDTDDIIVAHWRYYITNLLIANDGVNREIEATMNALKSYCWLEIERLNRVKGVDDKIYYIPASDIVDEFISIYGVKSDKTSGIDTELIKAIENEYESCDEINYDGYDLDSYKIRKELNVFTYHDIEALLKDKYVELHSMINNTSDILRKLEKINKLARLSENTSKHNVIYYLKHKLLSSNKELEISAISDDDISYAVEHLKYHEVIADKNDDDAIIFGKLPTKFADDVDFSFIDKRSCKVDPKKDDDNDADNNDDTDDNDAAGDPQQKTPGNKQDHQDTQQTTQTSNIVNLHCHTDESVGDGATSIEKLVNTAIQHGQKAIALTNHGTLNGLYKFNKICKKKGIKPILGIEAYISEDRHHLILLAKNYQGYQDLLTLHNKNVEYMKKNGLTRNDRYVNGGIYYTAIEQDKKLCSNLIALSGCLSGQIPKLLLADRYDDAKKLAIRYNSIFNQFYLELQYNGLAEQDKLNKLLIELSNDTGIPLTVTGDVHYISNKDDWNAIKYAHRKGSKAPASNNSFMTSAPEKLAESTIKIADSISSYDIQTSLHIPQPQHNRKWLKTYCYERLSELNINDAEHRQRLEQELTVIKDEIADYHILLYEIVENIKNVAGAIGGRGSAVGSLVCYLLGFHEVDPIKYGLLFERFLNVERIQKAIASDTVDTSLLPDIDLNIADDKKDEVFAVLESKYKYVAKVMTYSRLKAENKTIEKIKSLYPSADVIDLKYNLSVHAGGIILSTESFSQYLPVTLTRDNEIVTDCDLAEVESRGGIKYDLLGESSSKINEGIKIYDNEIKQLTKYLAQHPIGISQFTGYAARKYLRQHDIKTFDDLLEATALIRTGSNESWIFQEDMMQEATKYGISMADADFIRKPRGTTEQRQEKLEKILSIMKANGCSSQDIELFRNYHLSYSFNKSHAVAYTLESLKNAKLKKTNTALFFEKKLNHARDPIAIAELFDDAIKLGVDVMPPGRKYYQLDAKAVGNKLYIGTKFIKGISSKEPIVKGKFIKLYKEYLALSDTEKLYRCGAYDKDNLPSDLTCIGYKTLKDKVIVATISGKGYYNEWFEKNSNYDPKEVFVKGATISSAFIESYASI